MTRSSGISHIATLLATFTLSTSQVAFASEVTPYDGSLCRGVTYEDQENITRDDGDLSVSGATLVVCPIVKTTSGPGVWWGDEISNVSLSFTSASATCWLTIYSANIYGSHSESNAIEVDSGSISSSTISLSSSTAGYWIGMEAHHTWFYPELYCDISSGTLNGYTVTESGTDQAPNRITSAANCEQTTDGDYYVFVGPGEPASYPPYDPGLFGGYVESIGSGFDLECPYCQAPATRSKSLLVRQFRTRQTIRWVARRQTRIRGSTRPTPAMTFHRRSLRIPRRLPRRSFAQCTVIPPMGTARYSATEPRRAPTTSRDCSGREASGLDDAGWPG